MRVWSILAVSCIAAWYLHDLFRRREEPGLFKGAREKLALSDNAPYRRLYTRASGVQAISVKVFVAGLAAAMLLGFARAPLGIVSVALIISAAAFVTVMGTGIVRAWCVFRARSG